MIRRFANRLRSLAMFLGLIVFGYYRAETATAAEFNVAEWERQLRNPALTEKEFTSLYAQAIVAALKDAKVEITGPREVTIKPAKGGTFKAFVDNAWADAVQDPAHRPEICRRYIKTVVDATARSAAPAGLPDTNRIVAIVRDARYVQQFLNLTNKTTSSAGKLPVFETLTADIRILYAIDRDDGIATLLENDRIALGIELPALRQLALVNLRRILPTAKLHGTGPMFMLTADGNYESSLLLDDKIWEEHAKLVRGELVAAVPSRDVLIFTGSDSPEGLKELRQKTAGIVGGAGHVISKTLLVRRNGRWEEFRE